MYHHRTISVFIVPCSPNKSSKLMSPSKARAFSARQGMTVKNDRTAAEEDRCRGRPLQPLFASH